MMRTPVTTTLFAVVLLLDFAPRANAAAPPAPLAPAGAEAELVSEAAPAEVPAAEQASPGEQEAESSLDLDGEDMYLTFSPGSQPKVSEPPPAAPLSLSPRATGMRQPGPAPLSSYG